MSTLLWQKDGVVVDAAIQAFLAGDDVILDREFIRYDITASRAHASGLHKIGVLDADEWAAIDRELQQLDQDVVSGAFVLDAHYEDMHSAIEARLIDRLAETGKKIHTGRSRNDQVLVATRLWLKAQLLACQQHCTAIAQVALARAAQDRDVAIPGYTHLQRAMVSSGLMWWSAWAEAFIDNAERLRATAAWLDSNPLGTAAGYGVNMALDRAHVTEALGFARMQVSPIYAQLSRGKFEIAAIEAVCSALLDVRRLAWDLSLFTTAEFGFVKLPAHYTTGSSLMPNKRNPDVIEQLRAAYARCAASRTEIEQLMSLPSGYHRDLQFSKPGIVNAFKQGGMALALVPPLLDALAWVPEKLNASLDASMHATDLALELAQSGMPFRDAYQAAANPERWETRSAESSLQARVSPGGHAMPMLEILAARLQTLI